ncbi:MAG: TrkH family potassium uptake protein [Clostridia bacterium]|nr:TrkH family potassium uptake protein [Clostridia bacterium]
MNHLMVLRTVGRIVRAETLLLLLPAAVSLIYGDVWVMSSFLISAAIAFLVGTVLHLACRPKTKAIYAKEGFAIVALAWIGMSAIGALPFVISGEVPGYVDALFETVSGFTTTGASILADVESMSHGLLFWRSFTHWIGGMGVLVFVMALLPNLSDRSIHIMRAEMPGPVVGKLVPRAKDTAKILYLIYIGMTLAEIVFLLFGGMSFFESVVHSFGTAGTGGFGIKGDSVAGYSPYVQWVISVFMLLFGVNFNLYYLILIGRARSIFKSTELWAYFGIVGASVTAIAVNIYNMYGSIAESVRHSVFQVVSIITTTGYSTVDFDAWPDLSKTILFVLMFVGACAGSTGGGIKVSRIVLMGKMVFNELRFMVRPRSVNSLRFEGKAVGGTVQKSVANYFLMYIICYFVMFLIISFEPMGFESNFTAVAACFNNIGPGFAKVGPMANFAGYNAFSKVVLSFAMLLGRLEIFPLIIALSPRTWTKK